MPASGAVSFAGTVPRGGKTVTIKTPNGYSVIEVNCFPGYKGVPDGGARICDFILERAKTR